MNSTYAIVTPVCNEAAYISSMIDSVLTQTVLPQIWIIVDDGSTDSTASLVNAKTQGIPWIKVIKKSKRGDPSLEKGEALSAFLEGETYLVDSKVLYIAKVDGDLLLEPIYFETLLHQFSVNPRLGIASGSFWEKNVNEYRLQRAIGGSAWGAARIYRRACLEDLRKVTPTLAWDMVHVLLARTLDWQTEAYLNPRFYHLKKMGSRGGTLNGKLCYGRTSYILGYSFLYFLLRLIYQIPRFPVLIGSLAMLFGYVKAATQGIPLIVDETMKKELRKMQNAAISRILSLNRSLLLGHIRN